jgi:hypothetical protein
VYAERLENSRKKNSADTQAEIDEADKAGCKEISYGLPVLYNRSNGKCLQSQMQALFYQ